jgi:hypothetical protein
VSRFPNFLIIGAAKSGTYTLHTHFARHPEVFMCAAKEPHYFSFGAVSAQANSTRRGPVHSYISSYQAYSALFADHGDAKMAGESSVSYLYVPGTAERIFDYNPEMKLIVSLRNPVDRAYSSFNFAKSYGLEPSKTLAEGLEAEERRIHENGSILLRYRDLGLYSRHLARYYRVFPPDKIKVIIYEEFVQNPVEVVRDLYEFIGVSPAFEPDPNLHSNATKRPDDDNPLHNFINGQHLVRSAVRRLLPLKARMQIREFVREALFKPPPPLEDEERSKLKHLFDDDIRELKKQLGRDLSVWWD